MRIETVELKNIGPHQDLEVAFTGNSVGIVGANGAGKSSLVNAIYAAFTGDFSRFNAASKADVIYNGAKKTDKSYIRILGSHDGKTFELCRSLRPNTATLKFGDSLVEGATQVNDTVTNLIGLTSSVIERYVFVNQWEMFSFLNDSESVRAKAFQYLCGVESATAIHKACSAFRDKLQARSTIDNSLELESNIAELKQEMKKLKNFRVDGLLSSEDVDQISNELDSHVKSQQIQSLIAKANESVTEKTELIASINSEIGIVGGKLKAATDWLTKHKNFCDSASELVAAHKRQLFRQAEKAKIQAEIAKLEESRHWYWVELQQWEQCVISKNLLSSKEILEHTQQAKIVDRQIQDICDALNSIKAGNKTSCKSCLQELPSNHSDFLITQKEEKSTFYSSLMEKINASSEVDNRIEELKSILKKFNQDISTRKATLKGVSLSQEAEVTSSELEKANKVLSSKQRAENVLEQHRPKYEKLQSKLTSLEAKREQILSQLDDYASKLAELDACDVKAADAMREKLALHEVAYKQHTANLAAYKASAAQLKRTNEMLTSVKSKLAKEQKAKQLADIVDRVASVFHWSGLPKIVAQNNLVKLQSHINQELELFNSPFLVEATDDLSFSVTCPGKPSVLARQLSGGQKVILAIAFRGALDRLFGHNIGMLFLDEPTAGLDADNVVYFHEALQNWSANSGGKQIVVITHIQDMANAFDQVITVEK